MGADRQTQSSTRLPLSIAHSMLQMSGNQNPQLASYQSDYSYDIRRLLAQAEEIDRHSRISLRDAAMVAGQVQNNVPPWMLPRMQGLLGSGVMFGGAGAGLNPLSLPSRSHGLESVPSFPYQSVQNRMARSSKLNDNSLMMSINSALSNDTMMRNSQAFINNERSEKIAREMCDRQIYSNNRSSSETGEDSAMRKTSSKKNKFLRRQWEQEGNDDGSAESDSSETKRRKISKTQYEGGRLNLREQNISTNVIEPRFPSYLRKWEQIRTKVSQNFSGLAEEDRDLIVRGLFSDAIQAGQIILIREGGGGGDWSPGYNISGLRDRVTKAGHVMRGFPGVSSLCSGKRKLVHPSQIVAARV